MDFLVFGLFRVVVGWISMVREVVGEGFRLRSWNLLG